MQATEETVQKQEIQGVVKSSARRRGLTMNWRKKLLRSIVHQFHLLFPSADERVTNGIAFLDQTYGPVWRDKINWWRLDMASRHNCILGQLEGSYRHGLLKLNLTAEDAMRCGFVGARYNNLSRVWREKGSRLHKEDY